MKPLISIGFPIKNIDSKNLEEKIDLSKSLNAILNQTYTNLEIIISNNFSDEKTRIYLEEISKTDNRVKFFNQKKDLSLVENFKFVLDKSNGKYFKWNAADDIMSTDYIEHNVNFLENNLDYVSSSSKFCFEDQPEIINSFNLDGKLYFRIKNFFKYRHISHNIFYSLIRKETTSKTINITNDYWAIDWIFDLDLLLNGKFKTIDMGLTIYGTKGLSRQNKFKNRGIYSKKNIYKIFPYYELMKNLFFKTIFHKNLSILEKFSIYFLSVKINYHYFKQKYKFK